MGRAHEVRAKAMAATAAAKSALYNRMSRDIYLAAKKGSTDPNSNIALRSVIEKAKKAQVPSHVIDNAIKKAAGGSGEALNLVVYEGYGPGNSAIIVEALTDNKNRTVTYQIDQIKVVLPNETNDVQIVAGKDLCTLLTCTPYGINSHRLLVRGTRIENAAPVLHVTSNAYRIDSLVATPVVAAPILLILLIILMIKYRDKGSKPLISKEEEEWLKEEWG